MTTLNVLSRRSPKVRIPLPPFHRFQVRKLEPRTLPRTFRTLAEPSHPPSAGLRCRLTDDLQVCLLAARKLWGIQVSLQGLLARKPAILYRLLPARARAAPTLVKVALTVLRAHVRVFEGFQAEADAAVQVLLGDPSLTCGLGFVRLFFGGRRI